MFSKVITDSDLFLDMPVTSQLLYFHLGMQADDDGFVQLNSVARGLGSSKDDIAVLFLKGFLIQFEDSVVVITDWLVNNEIRRDRYKETFYKKHKSRLQISTSNQYSLPVTNLALVVPKNNHLDTQVRLGKVRLENKGTSNEVEPSSFGSGDINQLIEAIDKALGRKLATYDRKLLGNMVKLCEKYDSKGLVKKDREWLKDNWKHNITDFLVWYQKEKIEKGFIPQSTFKLYENFKLWFNNNGNLIINN